MSSVFRLNYIPTNLHCTPVLLRLFYGPSLVLIWVKYSSSVLSSKCCWSFRSWFLINRRHTSWLIRDAAQVAWNPGPQEGWDCILYNNDNASMISCLTLAPDAGVNGRVYFVITETHTQMIREKSFASFLSLSLSLRYTEESCCFFLHGSGLLVLCSREIVKVTECSCAEAEGS